MKTPRAHLCRGEGHGYLAIDLEASPSKALSAQVFNMSEMFVPCKVCYRTPVGSSPNTWSPVVVVPLLQSDLSVSLRDGDEIVWEGEFPKLSSKVESRILTMRNPELAAQLRSIESAQNPTSTQVDVLDIWPADDSTNAWRVRVSLPSDDADSPLQLWVLNHLGKPIPRELVVMEDHVVPGEHAPHDPVRLLTVSVLVDQSVRHACIYAFLDGEKDDEGKIERLHEGFRCLLPYQADELLARSQNRIAGAAQDPRYDDWFQAHKTSRDQLLRQTALVEELGPDAPLMSVVAPRANADQTLGSLQAQTYRYWELVSNPNDVRGDAVMFVDEGGTLEPDALWQCHEYLREHKSVDVLYADEDTIEDGRHVCPALKPEPNYDKLLSHYYMGYPLVVRRTALEQMGPLTGTSVGLCAYEAALKAHELGLGIAHIPRVLYHGAPTRVLPKPDEEASVVADHLARRNIRATVTPDAHPHANRVTYQLPDPAPHVCIVIPTKDHIDLLGTCITSILDRTIYPSYSIVVVENNSVDPQTFAYSDKIERIPNVEVIRWEPTQHAEGGFNYSAVVNQGARHGTGDLIVLLNNDTEVISPDWLQTMAGLFVRPEVGLVGAKLLFGDGLVQHAGLSANPNCDFLHPNQNLTATEPGYLLSAVVTSNMPMVTGACQMIRRSLFEELGGYDEELAVGFNDGDFCLRVLESGHEVVFCPHALLHHREFSTRGREATDRRLQARYLREKAHLMTLHSLFLADHDPTVSPWLDQFSPWRELL